MVLQVIYIHPEILRAKVEGREIDDEFYIKRRQNYFGANLEVVGGKVYKFNEGRFMDLINKLGKD